MNSSFAGNAAGSPAEPNHLRPLTKALYGIGQAANSIKAILFGMFSLYFYTTVLGLNGTLVGIATAMGLVWDALIDPVIGTLSDRAKGRLGKRHGFMFIGAAGMGISFWAYFSPPHGLSSAALFGWLLLTNLMVRTTTSIYAIPYFALGAELSSDYHERTSISGIRGAFGLSGTLAMAVLSFVLFFPTEYQGMDPKLNPEGYWAMGLWTGLLMTVVGIVTTLGTLSHRQYLENGRTPTQKHQEKFLSNMLKALKNRSFRALFFSYSLFFLGIVINATLTIHFLTYYVEVTESKSLSAFHLSFYLCALVGTVFWLKISKVIEKRWLYSSGTLATGLLVGCAFLLVGNGRPFGAGNLIPLLVGNGLAGFFASVLWVIPGSMIADISDEDQWINGDRREGIFFGLFNFGEQIAAGASILLTGVLIDQFAGLRPGVAYQSETTIDRIGMLFSLLPALLLVCAAIILVAGYTLDQQKVAAIQLELSTNQETVQNRQGSSELARR